MELSANNDTSHVSSVSCLFHKDIWRQVLFSPRKLGQKKLTNLPSSSGGPTGVPPPCTSGRGSQGEQGRWRTASEKKL